MILFLIISSVFSKDIFMNLMENKIYNDQYKNTEYNLAQQKLVNITNTTIPYDFLIDVAFQYKAFSTLQEVAILYIQEGVYGVYQIQYKKFIMDDSISTNSYQVLGNTSFNNDNAKCFGLIYLEDQIIVDCSIESTPDFYENYYFLQNGTYKQNVGFPNIEQRGLVQLGNTLVRITNNSIEQFDKDLNLLQSEDVDIIDVQVVNQDLYLLDSTAIYIMHEDDTQEEIPHQCSTTPTSMAIFSQIIYVACGQLVKIMNNLEVQLNPNINALKLSNTDNYLIINKQNVYEIINQTLLFTSNCSIYPTKNGDEVLLIDDFTIYPAFIQDITIINSENPTDFEIDYDHFWVIQDGLQPIIRNNQNNQNNKTKENQTTSYHEPQNTYVEYSKYLTGADLTIRTNGSDQLPFSYDLHNTLSNFTIYKAIGYVNQQILLIYKDSSSLYIVACHFDITDTNLIPKCQDKKLVSTNISTLTDLQAVYDKKSDQIVICYTESNTTSILIDGELQSQFSNAQKYQLDAEYLVVYNYSLFEIYHLQYGYYELEKQIDISTFQCDCVTIHQDTIYILSFNQSFMINNSPSRGWQLVDVSPIFTNKSQFCTISNEQLYIIGSNSIEIMKSLYVRGTTAFAMKNAKFISSKNYIYSFNNSAIYMYSTDMDQSLIGAFQHIIPIQSNKNFIAISIPDYEILLYDNKLFAYSQKPKFKPNTNANYDNYFKTINLTMIFGNQLYQKLTITDEMIATQLRLYAIQDKKLMSLQMKNNQTQLDINQLFNGPMGNISLDDESYYIQPRVYQVNQLQYSDILALQDNQSIILNPYPMFCDSDNNCTQIVGIKCNSIQQVQQMVFIICNDNLLLFSDLSDLQFSNVTLPNLDNSTSIKFSNTLLVGVQNETSLTIYNNFIYLAENSSEDMIDFIFNSSQVIVLKSKTLQILDENLTLIQSYDLMNMLANITAIFQDTVFTKILQIDETQYIISTSNALTYLLQFNADSIQILINFVSVRDTLPVELTCFNNTILAITHLNNYVTFYDKSQLSNNSNVLPYFQSLLLKNQRITTYQNGFQFVSTTNLPLIDQYIIETSPQIFSKKKGGSMVELIVTDLNGQKSNTLIQITQSDVESASKSKWDEIWDDPSLVISIYILGTVIAIMVIYFIIILIRRCCLMKKLKFIEQKPQEFSSEYI